MGRLFEGPGIWVILVVVILLFGATRLPALARSIGQSTKIFREEMKTEKPEAGTPDASVVTSTPAEPVVAPAVVPVAEQAVPPNSAGPGTTAKS